MKYEVKTSQNNSSLTGIVTEDASKAMEAFRAFVHDIEVDVLESEKKGKKSEHGRVEFRVLGDEYKEEAPKSVWSSLTSSMTASDSDKIDDQFIKKMRAAFNDGKTLVFKGTEIKTSMLDETMRDPPGTGENRLPEEKPQVGSIAKQAEDEEWIKTRCYHQGRNGMMYMSKVDDPNDWNMEPVEEEKQESPQTVQHLSTDASDEQPQTLREFIAAQSQDTIRTNG